MEVRDSFWLYGSRADRGLAWLTRAESRLLPGEVRRAQPAAHRWPTTDVAADVARTIRHVASGRRRSRHRELTPTAWRRIARVLPYARDLAGTFPECSGPNCFGAVMGAAGVSGAAERWMQREPFEEWLAASTVPGGTDADLGTVLVWRSVDGLVQHAAVTLGDGRALHKPSQGWMSPTKVLTTTELKFSARTPGHHLERHRLTIGS